MKLAIELDGGQHAEDGNSGNIIEERLDYLRANGIEVIRFWNNEVLQNIDGVLKFKSSLSEASFLNFAVRPETARGDNNRWSAPFF